MTNNTDTIAEQELPGSDRRENDYVIFLDKNGRIMEK
jgi:hypothetical protein